MTRQLTDGKPFSLILSFSIPVLLGYLFQQFYNVADTVIVGKALGVQALAAVGATSSVNFLIIGFVTGICSGFSIPVAQRFGAKDYSTMRSYVANSSYLSIVFSIIMAVFTVIFCRPLLRIMLTPKDIIEGASSYISIIFEGIPLIFLYNITAGIIRSLGDSKTPVYFLMLSASMNIGLDLLFILVFKFGIKGAAWATVISQGSAGLACLIYMYKKFEILRPNAQEKKFSIKNSATLCSVGIPMGLQYSITAIGSVILQTSLNTLGSDAVAASTAANRMSGFFCTVFDALGTTMATYGGQNTGAGKLDRLGEGVRDSMIISIIYSIAVFIFYFVAGQYLMMLFIDKSRIDIIRSAKTFLLESSSCYILLAVVNIVRFMIQGMGFSVFAILSGVFEMIARALIGIFVIPKWGFIAAGFASPFAWLLADCFLIPAFFWCRKKLQNIMIKKS